jgi:hypothetical protein
MPGQLAAELAAEVVGAAAQALPASVIAARVRPANSLRINFI